MNINPFGYVRATIESIDRYLLDNLSVLRARDLYEFYRVLFYELKGFFGGSWGFDGVTEILIFRVLHHLLGGDAKVVEVTRDLRAFYYPERNVVLGAGLPLMVGNMRIWPDIVIYEPKENNLVEMEKLRSVIEIKTYPQGGLGAIKREIKRLDSIHEHYCNSKLALIVYSINVKFKDFDKFLRLKELFREAGIDVEKFLG